MRFDLRRANKEELGTINERERAWKAAQQASNPNKFKAPRRRPIRHVLRKRLTNCTVYDARYFPAAQALGVSSATRLNGKSAKPGSTEPR
jgi:hypothetical protein